MSDLSTKQPNSSNTYAFGGSNLYGELGTGEKYPPESPKEVELSNIKTIACGKYDSAFVTEDGKVYTSGLLKYGRLDYEPGVYPLAPSLVPVYKTINDSDDPKSYTKELKKVTQIAVGSSFMVAVTDDNEVYSWGINTLSTLGTGDNNTRYESTFIKKFDNPIKKISCGEDHTALLLNDGTVWTWGWNCYGELGLGDTKQRNIPMEIPDLKNIIDISCGNYHTCAVNRYGIVYSFGNNQYGQLGLGDTKHRSIPTIIPTIRNINSVSGGFLHTAVIDINGDVYTFGNNCSGQLGLGDKVDRLIPTKIEVIRNVKQISCGSYTTAMITNTGKLVTIGQQLCNYADHNQISIIQIQEDVSEVVCKGHLIFKIKIKID